MLILDDLLFLPAKLFLDICEKIKEMADEATLSTLESIKKRFMQVQTEYDEGKISLDEYQQAVAFLSARLDALAENGGAKKQ